jgi:hypothetical protein
MAAAGAGLGPNAANGDDTAKSPPARLALSALGGVAQEQAWPVDREPCAARIGGRCAGGVGASGGLRRCLRGSRVGRTIGWNSGVCI